MYCIKCGNDLSSDWAFCIRCGSPTGVSTGSPSKQHILVQIQEAENLIVEALAQGLEAGDIDPSEQSSIAAYTLDEVAFSRSETDLYRRITTMAQCWPAFRRLQDSRWVVAVRDAQPEEFGGQQLQISALRSLIRVATEPGAGSPPDLELAAEFVMRNFDFSGASDDDPIADALSTYCDAADFGAALRDRIYNSSPEVLQRDLGLMSNGGIQRYLEETRLVSSSARRRILAAGNIAEKLKERLLMLYLIEAGKGRINVGANERNGLCSHFGFIQVATAMTVNNLSV